MGSTPKQQINTFQTMIRPRQEINVPQPTPEQDAQRITANTPT